MALSGFDKSYYLSAKLQALQAGTLGWAGKDVVYLDVILSNVYNLTAEQHYMKYGYLEGLSPNAYFNHDEYRYAKATDMVKKGLSANIQDALALFSKAWTGDAYQHYIQYGASEGINPSNKFDESEYLESKLSALKSFNNTAGQWAGKSINDLRTFLSRIGLTALEHFLHYGIMEGLTAIPVPINEQVHVSGINPQPVSVYSLTVGSDIVTGGSEDNTFNGFTTNKLQTLTGGDILDGGGGIDTIFSQLSNIAIITPTLRNIEVLQFNSTLAEGATYNAAQTTGVIKLENIQSTTPLSVINLNSMLTSGLFVSNSMAGITVAFEDSVLSGSSDAITISIDGYSGNDRFLLGSESDPNGDIESLTILATGAPSNFGTGFIDMGDVTTVRVNASAKLDLGATAGFESMTIFNASGSTAGVHAKFANKPLPDTSVLLTGGRGDDFFDVTPFNDNVSLFVNLGDGNDTIAFLKDNFQSSWDIDGGSGNNTLEVDQGVILSNTYTNFQAIAFKGNSSVVQDMNDLPDSITSVHIGVADGKSVTIMNLDDEDSVILKGDQSAAIILEGGGGLNTINLVLDDEDLQGVNIDDPDGGVVIDSNIQKIVLIPGSGQTHSLDMNASSSLSEIEIVGSGSIDLRGKDGGVALNSATTFVNAVTLSGCLSVLASGSNTTIQGGSNGDILFGGAGNDTFTGNAGNDTISGGAGTNMLTGNAGADLITCDGTDSVVFLEVADGTPVKTLTSLVTSSDDLAKSRADVVNSFSSGSDKIRIDGNLQALINNYGTNDDLSLALLAAGDTFNYNAATVFVITAQVGAAEIGDISQLSTLFNDRLTAAKQGALPGQEILFTAENLNKKTGLYYFKDVDGNSEISPGDVISLLAVVSAQLVAGDFTFG